MTSKHRGDYWDCVTLLSTDHYYRSLHDVAKKNRLTLVGHVNCEGTFPPHVKYNGEYFRVFQHFDWAGVDQLGKHMRLDGVESYWNSNNPKIPNLITNNWLLDARLSRSTAVICNKPRQMVECFGAANWDIKLADCKTIVDTLLATGCDLFIPHAISYSLDGYRKNDHPAAFNYQPYYKHWNVIADYTARLCSLFNLQNGYDQIPILCVYPIRSFWAEMQPHSSLESKFLGNILPFFSESLNRQQLDHIFAPEEQILKCRVKKNLILLNSSEKNMQNSSQFEKTDYIFNCLILGSLTTIGLDFAEWLLQYFNQGGKILAMGTLPTKIYNLIKNDEDLVSRNFDLNNPDKQNSRLREIWQTIFKIDVNLYQTLWKSKKIERCFLHENSNSAGGYASFLEIPFGDTIPNDISYWIEKQMNFLFPIQDRSFTFWKHDCVSQEGGHPGYLLTREKKNKSNTFLFIANTSQTIEYPQVEILIQNDFDRLKIWDPQSGDSSEVNFPPNTKQFKLDFPPYQSYCLSFHNSGKKIETKGNFDLIEFSRKKNDHFSSKKIELSSNWNLILDGNNAAFLGKNWHFAIKSWAIDEFKYGTTYTYSHKFILQSKEQIGQLSLMIDGLVGDRCWGKDFYDELKGGQYAQFDPKSIPKITINNSPIHINFDYKIKYLDPFWLISDITPLVQNGENIITVVSESHVDKFYAHLITDPWKIIGKFCVNEKNADNIPILSPIITKVSCEDLNLLGLSHYYGTLRYEQLVQMPDKSNCRATLCLHDIKDCVEIHINHKPLSVCWWNWTVDISNYVKWGNENIITLFYNGTAQNFIESDSHPFGIQGKIEVIIENL